MPISIAIADDHELTRTGLLTICRSEIDFHIVCEIADTTLVVQACMSHQPDVLVLVLSAQGFADVLDTVVGVSPMTQVVAFGERDAYPEHRDVSSAICILPRTATRDQIVEAIRTCQHKSTSQTPIPVGLKPPVAIEKSINPNSAYSLTDRERDVLQLLVQGQTNKEIGRALGIAPGTVKTHVESIIEKLSAADRTQAAVIAVRARLIADRDW